jgi:hypothetical protein
VDVVDELVQLVPLKVKEQTRLLVAAREVDVHVRHCCAVMWCESVVLGVFLARPRVVGCLW